MLDLATTYRQAGDEQSARAALQYNLLLAQQLGGSATDPLICQIGVGLAGGQPRRDAHRSGQVLSFGETADERTALERLIQNIPGMSEEEGTALKNHAARLSSKSSGSC